MFFKKIFKILTLTTIMTFALTSCENANNLHSAKQQYSSTISVEQSSEPESIFETETATLDKLQQLYVDIDTDLSLSEMVNFLDSYGLPYSFEQYNGSRQFQVAFTEGCTAQKYKKESGDYLIIKYNYPKNENSSNDHFEKYSFGACQYCPSDSKLSLICYVSGSYLSCKAPGNYIDKLGSILNLDSSMSRTEQMEYYLKNKATSK